MDDKGMFMYAAMPGGILQQHQRVLLPRLCHG